MKKTVYWANRQTIPHIKLLTWLKWLFGLFSGLNTIVAAIYAQAKYGDKIRTIGLVIGAMLLIITYCKATSPHKGYRDTSATIADGCMFCIISVALLCFFPAWKLIILFCTEVVVIFIVSFFQSAKKRKGNTKGAKCRLMRKKNG